MNTQTIKNKLKQQFNYLQKEYGFQEVSIDINDDYCVIEMKNHTTGIILNYERSDDDIIIFLCRLINGEIVRDKNPISETVPLNTIDLNYIIKFKKGENDISALHSRSMSVNELIKNKATDLKTYADDVLQGNFDVFNKVDALAKKRRLEWLNQ